MDRLRDLPRTLLRQGRGAAARRAGGCGCPGTRLRLRPAHLWRRCEVLLLRGRMTPDLLTRIAAIEQRAEAATPGPWRRCGAHLGQCECGLVWSEPTDDTPIIA